MPEEIATPKKSPRTIAVTLPVDVRAQLQAAADAADRDLGPFLSRAIKNLDEDGMTKLLAAGK